MFQSSKDLIWSNEPFAERNLLDSVMLKQSVLKVFMSFVVMQKKASLCKNYVTDHFAFSGDLHQFKSVVAGWKMFGWTNVD